jgi:hypothetical protein
VKTRTEPCVFVLGGNANTLAFTSSFRSDHTQISAWLVPLAWTPIGVSFGETWQRVGVASDAIATWVDQTFPSEDERSFVASMRDIEMLIRLGWHAEPPTELSEELLLNIEDLPQDLLDALDEPPAELTQCAVCRRICVRDDFVWNERRLCAWDYHSMVFGRRGPWRNEPYEERLFATLPAPAYVSPALLEDANVEIVASFQGLPVTLMHRLINEVIAQAPGAAYLAVNTASGIVVLREHTHDPETTITDEGKTA